MNPKNSEADEVLSRQGQLVGKQRCCGLIWSFKDVDGVADSMRWMGKTSVASERTRRTGGRWPEEKARRTASIEDDEESRRRHGAECEVRRDMTLGPGREKRQEGGRERWRRCWPGKLAGKQQKERQLSNE